MRSTCLSAFMKAAAFKPEQVAGVVEEMKSLPVNPRPPIHILHRPTPVNAAWSILMTEKLVGMKRERLHLAELSSLFPPRIEGDFRRLYRIHLRR